MVYTEPITAEELIQHIEKKNDINITKDILVVGCSVCANISSSYFQESKGILGAIRIMMFGNVAGIAWGSFVNRFRKEEEADERSSLLYEIGIILATIIYLPIALIHALLAKLFRVATIKFKDVEKK